MKYSQIVDLSTDHILGIATSCEQWLNPLMISERQFQLAVGERLRDLRTALDKTQEELGKKAGVGKTAISNYEKGDRKITGFAAYKLKMAYGVPLEWLLGGDESVLPPSLAERLKKTSKTLRTA